MAEQTFKPTAGVAANAKRALKWIAEGHAGGGFTDVGRRRASQLANREAVSADTIRRMNSFFARHEVDKKGKDFNNMEKPSAGRVAWDAWGGDEGQKWAKRIAAQLDREEDKSMSSKAVNTIEASAYAPIVKFEEREDGTLLVYGKATDDSLDSDEQVCDPAWLDRAMPQWFKFGNVREQHSNIAAGVAVEYEKVNETEHFITVNVVDKNSQAKVKAGVLKGFSIGIRKPRVVKDNKAIGGRIVDGDIVEVSLVDRPANPSCVLTVAKALDTGTLEQVEVFAKGATMENELITEQEVVAVPLPVEEVEDNMAALAKSIGEVTALKFDRAAYDAARRALADLIAMEAKEFAEGHDERHSLWSLMNAVTALLDWFSGEAAEGEVSEAIEMADEPDAPKCLDCGCHKPADSHGSANVSVAEIVSEKADDSEDKMCKDCGKAEDECECDTELAIASDTDKNDDIKTLVTDLVKTLLTDNGREVETKSDSATEERIKALEAELEQVKALAVSGGPSRMGAANKLNKSDEVASAVALLRQKAANTLDAKLAEGYRLQATDLEKSLNSK